MNKSSINLEREVFLLFVAYEDEPDLDLRHWSQASAMAPSCRDSPPLHVALLWLSALARVAGTPATLAPKRLRMLLYWSTASC